MNCFVKKLIFHFILFYLASGGSSFALPSIENDSLSSIDIEESSLFEKPKNKSKAKKKGRRTFLGIKLLSKTERQVFKRPNKFNKTKRHRVGKIRKKSGYKNKTGYKKSFFRQKKNMVRKKPRKKNFYNKDRR